MKKAYIAGMAALALAGCGGGSSGASSDSTGPTLQSAPVSQAFSIENGQQHSTTLTAQYEGHTYTVQIGYVPSGAATFNGMAAESGQQTTTVSADGAVANTDISTVYFNNSDPDAFEIFGSQDANGTQYEVFASPGLIPSTVNVGDNGPIGSATIYHDSNMQVQDAQVTETYSVQANDASTLLFCQNAQIQNVTTQGQSDGLSAASGSECYAIGTSGAAALVSATVFIPSLNAVLDFH